MRGHLTKYGAVAALWLLLSLATTVADAQTRPSIIVGGVWAFNITQPAGGISAEDRVTEVQKRITDVLSRYRAGQAVPVKVRPLGASANVEVGEIVVVTVTPADAAGTGVTTFELARQWARRLHQGLLVALPDATFHVF